MFEIRTRLIRIVLEFWAFFKIMINVPFQMHFGFVWLPNNDLINKIIKISKKIIKNVIMKSSIRTGYGINIKSA